MASQIGEKAMPQTNLEALQVVALGLTSRGFLHDSKEVATAAAELRASREEIERLRRQQLDDETEHQALFDERDLWRAEAEAAEALANYQSKQTWQAYQSAVRARKKGTQMNAK